MGMGVAAHGDYPRGNPGMRSSTPEAAKQAGSEGPVKRDRLGRILPGSACLSPETAFRPGKSGNPGGKRKGPVASLKAYLEGDTGLPATWEKHLPPEVWEVLTQEGLGPALALGVISMALNPKLDAKDRMAAIRWITERYDGPPVKQQDQTTTSIQRREVVIVADSLDGKEPEFPAEEVLEIEQAEARAREDANKRRREALGMRHE